MKTIKVVWFNDEKGFGEGRDKDDNIIFLCKQAFTHTVKTLKKGQRIKATVKHSKEFMHYAYEIRHF